MQVRFRKLTQRHFIFILLVSIVSFSLPGHSSLAMQPFNAENPQNIRPTTTAGLRAFYQTLDYDWQKIDNGIPPFILESIPKDINSSVSTSVKKRAFFMGLLPMVLLANREIRQERNEIKQILERNEHRKLKDGDRERIREIARRYGLRGRPLIDHRTRTLLLRRVDTLPPSLVLAQAANESAWGTSRFARLGNNIFGEWTFKPGTGIVPEGRPEGAIYEVRKFNSIYQSIRSYINNINRHNAYRNLRKIREKLRKSSKQVTGTALAKGLEKYSQRGEAYVKEIQLMIRQNDLERINTASLRLPTERSQNLTTISTSGAGLLSSRNRIIGHRSESGRNP